MARKNSGKKKANGKVNGEHKGEDDGLMFTIDTEPSKVPEELQYQEDKEGDNTNVENAGENTPNLPYHLNHGTTLLSSDVDADGMESTHDETFANFDELPSANVADSDDGNEQYGDYNEESKCANCKKFGHVTKKCESIRCIICGVLDQHRKQNCPMFINCWRCGQHGHQVKDCSLLHQPRCKVCRKSHFKNKCPKYWENYLPFVPAPKKYLPIRAYCYQCAKQGHFGDDCPDIQSKIHYLGPSAFRGSGASFMAYGRNGRGSYLPYDDDYYSDDYDDYSNYVLNRRDPRLPRVRSPPRQRQYHPNSNRLKDRIGSANSFASPNWKAMSEEDRCPKKSNGKRPKKPKQKRARSESSQDQPGGSKKKKKYSGSYM